MIGNKLKYISHCEWQQNLNRFPFLSKGSGQVHLLQDISWKKSSSRQKNPMSLKSPFSPPNHRLRTSSLNPYTLWNNCCEPWNSKDYMQDSYTSPSASIELTWPKSRQDQWSKYSTRNNKDLNLMAGSKYLIVEASTIVNSLFAGCWTKFQEILSPRWNWLGF